MRRRRFIGLFGAAAVGGRAAASVESFGDTTAGVDAVEYDSGSSLLDADMRPLTDEDLVAVWAEDSAYNEDADYWNNAVDYGDRSIPLVAVDGRVVGIGAPLVADDKLDSGYDNVEFLLNVWDAKVDGSTVLWDESHDQYWTLDRFSAFESAAANRGYDVRPTFDLTDDLSGADALVVAAPRWDFWDADLDAVADFVAGGGTLFLINRSDHNDYDQGHRLNDLAARLDVGFRFNDDQVVDPRSNAGREFEPVTSNFNSDFPFFGGSDPNRAPTADLSPTTPTVNPGQSLTFDASGSDDPDGSIASYEWSFGDGTTATGRTASHAYGATGEYTVRLTVTDGDGASDAATTTVTVTDANDAPTAAFSVSNTTLAPGDSLSVDAADSSDSDGSIASYEWSFGDGTTATGRTASHAYDSAGDYAVTLTVTDDDGATATASKTVTVESGSGSGRTEVTVRSVLDGDTVKVDYQGTEESIRVLGVDTAEKPSNQQYEREEEWEGIESLNVLGEWGTRGKQFAEQRFSQGDTVEIAFDDAEGKRDPFDRLLAYVYYDPDGDGTRDTLYNEELVREGYARIYGSNLLKHGQIWTAEQEARSADRGIWTNSDPASSSEFRNAPVDELFVPKPAPVRTSSGAPADSRVPVFAESSARTEGGDSYDRIPLAAVDEDASVAAVSGLMINENYEQEEGFGADTSGYGNYPFLTNLVDYVGSGSGDVLIDGGHGQFGADFALSNEDAAYYQRHLEGFDLDFDQFNDLANPPAPLSNYRTVIVTPPAEDFTAAERDALKTYVDSGGSVVFVGSGAATDAARRRMNDLASALGSDLRLGSGQVRDGSNNLNNDDAIPTTANFNDSFPLFSAYDPGGNDGGGGGGGGGGSASKSMSGRLSGADDSATHSYAARTDDPSGMTLTLSGPGDADFDLYATLDGRTPTTSDYDVRSWTYGSAEEISLDGSDLDADTEIGILVHSYDGSGEYSLTVEEQ